MRPLRLLAAAAAVGVAGLTAGVLSGPAATVAFFGDGAAVAGNVFSTGTWATSTGWLNPTADGPVTGVGDGNGFERNPGNAYTAGGGVAQDRNSGTVASLDCDSAGRDKHVFWGFQAAIPPSSSVSGIEVQLIANSNNASGSPAICVELSWDGGLTWTQPRITPNLNPSRRTFTLGSSTETWGHSWTGEEANSLRVRLTMIAGATNKTFSLDWVGIQVHY